MKSLKDQKMMLDILSEVVVVVVFISFNIKHFYK